LKDTDIQREKKERKKERMRERERERERETRNFPKFNLHIKLKTYFF
jgi:hypothetical protein